MTEKNDSFEEQAKETMHDIANGANQIVNQENKKVLAGILGIIIGAFGIHKFVLGYKKEGLIMLLITILSCGFLGAISSIIGLVEGIIYLTKTDEEFYQTYQVGKKPWF